MRPSNVFIEYIQTQKNKKDLSSMKDSGDVHVALLGLFSKNCEKRDWSGGVEVAGWDYMAKTAILLEGFSYNFIGKQFWCVFLQLPK